MLPVIEYVHAIDGRLRIKVPELKRSPARARQFEDRFAGLEGIHEVRANPVTGNVLFLYDPERILDREIVGALISAGYLGMGIDGDGRQDGDHGAVALVVARVVTWFLLRGYGGLQPGQEVIERLLEAAARFVLNLFFGRTALAPS